MTKPHFRFTVFLAAGYLVAVALIAFWPTPVDHPVSGSLGSAIGWLHEHGMPGFIGYNQVEFVANILLFLPFGYLAAAWTGKWPRALVAGFTASCLIEFGQALLLPNRFSSLLDIVANTIGAALGIGIHVFLHGQYAGQQPDVPPAPERGPDPRSGRDTGVNDHSGSSIS